MEDARPKSRRILFTKGPLRVVAVITLWSFLLTTGGGGDILWEIVLSHMGQSIAPSVIGQDEAWAAGTDAGYPSVAQTGTGSHAIKRFNLKTFSLPPYLAKICSSWQSPVAAGPTVIHIQDAHCNYAGQHKIAEIIDYLENEYGVGTVNLEGGKGEYDLSIFSGIKNPRDRERVVDHFVKQGLVNGAVLYEVMKPHSIELWGIEDTGLYLENLGAYRDSLSHGDEVDGYLGAITHILNNLKRHIYSPDLMEL
ncbi:MAG: hypothetical protein ABH885_03125, partial [Candidatus Omnitrophota bacterium]